MERRRKYTTQETILSVINSEPEIDSTRLFPFRDKRNRIIWKANDSPEDNLRLGIMNVRGLLFSAIPQLEVLFRTHTPLSEQEKQDFESLILEHLKDNKTLKQSLLPQQKSLYDEEHQYFGINLALTLATSFSPWNLFEKEKWQTSQLKERKNKGQKRLNSSKSEEIVIEGLDHGGNKQTIKAISQQDGVKMIYELLNGTRDFSQLRLIVLVDVRETKRGSGSVYISRRYQALELNNEAYEAYRHDGTLLLIPRSNTKFGYEWFDVYPINNGFVDANNRIDSLRVTRNPVKIGSLGWYGPERQAFLDYITGQLDLTDPNELEPFIAKRIKGGDIYLGRIQEQDITIAFHRNLEISEIIIVPHYNAREKYLWIEGFAMSNLQKGPLLFKRKVVKEGASPTIKIETFSGPDIEILLDWIYNKISIKELKPFEIKLDPGLRRKQLFLQKPNLIIQLPSQRFNSSLPIRIVPSENSRYRWIRLQQGIEDDKPTVITHVLIRMVNEHPTFQCGWHGPERQALIDFIDGIADKDELQEFQASTSEQGQIYLCKYKDRVLRIIVRSNAFQAKEILQLKPCVDSSGNLVIYIFKVGQTKPSAKSTFDKVVSNFVTETIEETGRQPDGYWSHERIEQAVYSFYREYGTTSLTVIQKYRPSLGALISKYPGGISAIRLKLNVDCMPEVDKNTGYAQDERGNMLVSVLFLASKFQISIHTLYGILSKANIQSIKGRGKNNKHIPLYPYIEAKAAIEIYQQEESKNEIPLGLAILQKYKQALLDDEVKSFEEFIRREK